MESNAKPGEVNISEAGYKFTSRGEVKGKGDLAMYFVEA
ncbi:MAG: hypothetical protein ACI8YQ_001539 [Polaribacter sp.]|jgi:hypothetical protein